MSIKTAIALGTLTTLLAAVAVGYTNQSFRSACFTVCPGIAFTIMLLVGSDAVIERLQSWVHRAPLRLVLAPVTLWLLYAIYAVGMNVLTGRSLLVMGVYLGLPFLILGLPIKAAVRIWLEPVVILGVWLPLEFGVIRNALITHRGLDLHYGFAQLLAVDAGLLAFAVWNQTPQIGYRFEWSRPIVQTGLTNFLKFAVLGIPLGLAIRFVHFVPTANKLLVAVPQFIGIFLFTALPEEFLFRGLIQNWLERMTRQKPASLILASIIFGASHLNNGTPLPNYKYFLMATIAGVFYGRAWQGTRSLMSSSLTHSLVDTCWSVLFR